MNARREAEPVAAAPLAARATIYELDERLDAIREEMAGQRISDAKAVTDLRDTIAAIECEDERDRKPRRRGDRAAYELRKRHREHRLAELREQEANMLERTPGPERMLNRAHDLREEQRRLGAEQDKWRAHAIEEEVAQHPVWLEEALGPEPAAGHLREKWHRTARELAGLRIDRRVTSSDTPARELTTDLPLPRAIADTRTGWEVQREHQDVTLGW
jgi:hypothetical protein